MQIVINQIYNKHEAQLFNYYSEHPYDYICEPGRFIRTNEQGKSPMYYFFDKGQTIGTGGFVSYIYSHKELIQLLQDKNISLNQCKNQSGLSLTVTRKGSK